MLIVIWLCVYYEDKVYVILSFIGSSKPRQTRGNAGVHHGSGQQAQQLLLQRKDAS